MVGPVPIFENRRGLYWGCLGSTGWGGREAGVMARLKDGHKGGVVAIRTGRGYPEDGWSALDSHDGVGIFWSRWGYDYCGLKNLPVG
eukprot:767286-Hanusia_phi.AAC.4